MRELVHSLADSGPPGPGSGLQVITCRSSEGAVN